jgi:hypothetical protein
VDDASGYHASGDPEVCGLWTSESGVLQPVIDSLTADDIPHTYVLRPKPLYLGIGGALYDAGVPGASFIAGPGHLVNVVANGHIDKFDAALAERQTRWTANLLTTFDGMTAAEMMRGDVQLTRPSLGKHKPFPPKRPPAPACLPSSTKPHGRGVGGIRIGMTPDRLRARSIQARSTRKGVYRYCVDGTPGSVDAVVDQGRVRLVTSTARSTLPSLKQVPKRRPLRPGLFRAAPRSSRVVGIRKGRVSYTGVTEPGVIRDVRLLSKLVRRAGL